MPFVVLVGAVIVGNVVTEMIGNGLEKLHPKIVKFGQWLESKHQKPKAAE